MNGSLAFLGQHGWTIICEKVPDYDLGDHPLDLMVVDENTVVGAVPGRGELYFFCLKRKGTEGGQNEAPLASAGGDQKVSMWHKVTLDGRGSIVENDSQRGIDFIHTTTLETSSIDGRMHLSIQVLTAKLWFASQLMILGSSLF